MIVTLSLHWIDRNPTLDHSTAPYRRKKNLEIWNFDYTWYVFDISQVWNSDGIPHATDENDHPTDPITGSLMLLQSFHLISVTWIQFITIIRNRVKYEKDSIALNYEHIPSQVPNEFPKQKLYVLRNVGKQW